MNKYTVTIALKVNIEVEADSPLAAYDEAMNQWHSGKITEELGPNWTNDLAYLERIKADDPPPLTFPI